MKLKFLAVLAVPALFACQKKQPENIPQPKAEQAQAAVSTAPVVDQNPLTAPGTYLKTTVGRVQQAKDAKALYEATEKKNLDSLNLNDPGGN
ncbi:MAG: hypothetical protein PHV33_06500 [Elusimicrobiales bacterium]|nr:hypothetical protein [Elusimicrobiales bacterium]